MEGREGGSRLEKTTGQRRLHLFIGREQNVTDHLGSLDWVSKLKAPGSATRGESNCTDIPLLYL